MREAKCSFRVLCPARPPLRPQPWPSDGQPAGNQVPGPPGIKSLRELEWLSPMAAAAAVGPLRRRPHRLSPSPGRPITKRDLDRPDPAPPNPSRTVTASGLKRRLALRLAAPAAHARATVYKAY